MTICVSTSFIELYKKHSWDVGYGLSNSTKTDMVSTVNIQKVNGTNLIGKVLRLSMDKFLLGCMFYTDVMSLAVLIQPISILERQPTMPEIWWKEGG